MMKKEGTLNTNKHRIRVLLIDDQKMIGEAVRRMLEPEADIEFHFCEDPAKAITMAVELSPTVILQDLVMPQIDGLTLVKYMRANPRTQKVPMIVLSSKEEPETKAKAFELGANDYLVKLPDRIELVARIRYHSTGYIHLLERDEAWEALVESQRHLAAELNEAAEYVKSLLPEPIDYQRGDSRKILADWVFITSTSLGGDSFGYHWLDDDHFALYLLDVCGHGVGAALLSVSAMNVLRAQSLPRTDFREPSAVLESLNEAFPMENQNNMYFTIWYGVYRPSTRTMTYSSGGHPPAVLLQYDGDDHPQLLKTPGMVIGGMPGMQYRQETVSIGASNKLFLFSDGVYELIDPATGKPMEFDDYVKILQESDPGLVSEVKRIHERMLKMNGNRPFEDDFSLVQLSFLNN